MTSRRLLDLYPDAWRRLCQHIEQLTNETGLQFELGDVFVRKDHLVGSYSAIDGRQRAAFYCSTPLTLDKPRRRWWDRGDAA